MTPRANEPMLRIDKDFISALPLLQYQGKIVLVDSAKAAKKAVKELSREKILGFDTETRPCFHKGDGYLVSLVQLCGKKCAYLFRLDYCGGVPVLFPLFENPKILKVGVAVKDDVLHLKARAPFDDAGFVDASKYTREAHIENTGLRALTAHFLGGRISKAAQVSNWAAVKLSPQQIVYAATDAWTSRELFLKLQALGIAPKIDSADSICETEVLAEPAAPKPSETETAGKKQKPRRENRRRENANAKTVPANARTVPAKKKDAARKNGAGKSAATSGNGAKDKATKNAGATKKPAAKNGRVAGNSSEKRAAHADDFRRADGAPAGDASAHGATPGDASAANAATGTR